MEIILVVVAFSGLAYFILRSKKSDSKNTGTGNGSGYGDSGQDEYGYDDTNR